MKELKSDSVEYEEEGRWWGVIGTEVQIKGIFGEGGGV